ncbi:J domain-containing protein [Nitratiruptor tergarcus]|uniref:DnaJ-class molecular chaperone with C-terminal Zn finger domain n=1 Tax=Nitratiruptor tergarcus DSM 16512 TaxID=1069081 RepID=A0A1W1WV45_9BACT|nr:J domain-containing protein [Nitratiruptor tergarcus]SMC10085.1 DnaJ-class molecular chaperone with C-terminal Zn finger domain [Nitratiruptor tergarcus DSM 16512]
MRRDPVTLIHEALETLGLPPMVSYKEIKERYRELSKRYHPDRGDESEKMAQINHAYEILKNYIENYKFSFSQEEILKQFPFEEYVNKFRF